MCSLDNDTADVIRKPKTTGRYATEGIFRKLTTIPIIPAQSARSAPVISRRKPYFLLDLRM
jgi:hypothetical protein